MFAFHRATPPPRPVATSHPESPRSPSGSPSRLQAVTQICRVESGGYAIGLDGSNLLC
jgi:hypothetical protein